MRRDPFGRFVSAIAWLPREGFDTRLRERVGEMLAQAFGGRLSAFYIALGDAPLARIHYIIGTDPARPREVDEAVLEAAVAQAARSFSERLGEALTVERGEAAAAALLGRWRDAFPPAYRESATGAQGAADLALAERALAEGRPAAALSRPAGSDGALSLRLVNPGGPLPLADALPLFESLGLRAVEEMPYRLSPESGTTAVLHVFALRPDAALSEQGAPFGATDERFPAVLEALAALLEGQAEADGFNRLVLRSGLTWRECWLLRAMFRWLKQVGFAFEQGSVEAALAAHPMAGRLLLDLFHARLDPDFAGDRAAREAALVADWNALLDEVANPDEDRILARFRLLLDAVLRTNYHQYKPYISFKIDSAAAGDMPAPRPWREVFVHSPRMEGTHLRAGPVARGGIRWSDRREDFRTEILGLMKAQRVKNVVIVPTGAKGGFVLKRPPPAADREAFGAEGVACYQTLVRGLLDITDNLDGERVVPPERVVRRDADDPYLVVAADKGTATFSDIANGAERRARLLARRRLRLRRLGRLRPQGHGHHRARRLGDGGAALRGARPRHLLAGLHLRRRRRHVGRRVRQRAADLAAHQAGRGLRPPARLHRPRSRPGRVLRRARAAVPPAALLLGGLRPGEDLGGRRRLPARRQARAAVRAGAGDAGHRGGAAGAGGGGPRDPARAGGPALLRRHRHLCEGERRNARPRPATAPTTRCAWTGGTSARAWWARARTSP